MAGAPLVDERQICVQVLAESLRGLHPAGVGRHHHDVLCDLDVLAQVVGQYGQGGEVIDREVEEALDLPRVQVDRDHPVRPGGGEGVGDELRRDRLAGQRLLVLPGVPVVRDHRGDPLGRGALQRVDHHQLLPDHLVDRIGVGLDDEGVAPPSRFDGTPVDLP